MKFKILFALLFLPLLSASPFSQGDGSKIVATVGTHNITLDQFTERYSNYLFSTGVKDNIVVREAILNNMINEILLINYDSNEEIVNDFEYQKKLEESRVGTILAYLKDQEIYSKISVTEKEVREAFARANEKIAARHLYAATEEEANNLYELLKVGVSFETLAKQVFTDSVLKNNGGFLGYFTWGDMDPAFEEAAYSLKVGEISAPIKTAQGYSIIRVDDRNKKPLITETEFQNKKSHMENVLKIRKKVPYESEYINNVFDDNKLLFNDESLKSLLNNLYTNDLNEINSNQECVIYEDEKFNQAEIAEKISNLPYYHRERINSIEALKAAINGLIIKDILYEIALQKGYDSAEPVIDRIEVSKKNIFLQHKFESISKNTSLPDSVIYKFYEKNLYKFSTERELNLQEIIVTDKEMADSLFSKINNNEDFGALAKKFSIRKWSADNDGVMGFAPISRFGSYGDLFWESEIGKTIGPLKVENFYGIFRVLGKNDSKPIEFEKVKNEAAEEAQFEKQTEIVQNYINLLHEKIKVTVNDELLRSHNISDLVFKN